MDITPPELLAQHLYTLTISQETPSTVYISVYRGPNAQNGIYSFREGQQPQFTSLTNNSFGATTFPLILRDELYYPDFNCVKKVSLKDASITLIAGSCETSGYKDGIASQALFNGPTALAVDALGRIYVVDKGNFRVRKIENNQVSTYAGKWIATDHPTQGLNYSCEAGVCTAGNLYDPIDRIDYSLRGEPAGKPIQPFIQANDLSKPGVPAKVLPIVQDGDRGSATFWRPGQLALDSLGNLYVSDQIAFQHHIRRISPDGHVTTLVADTNHPDPNHNHDNLYPQALHTLDSLTEQDRIRALSVSGTMLFTVSGTKLYVLSKHLYRLDLLAGTWKIAIHQQELERHMQIEAQGDNPPGIRDFASDPQGNLYVLLSKSIGLDSGINKLLKITFPANE